MSDPLPRRLSELKNIGHVTERQLQSVGINTPDDLARMGSLEAYWRLHRALFDRITLVAIYALEGALLDEHWNALPDDVRDDLRRRAAEL